MLFRNIFLILTFTLYVCASPILSKRFLFSNSTVSARQVSTSIIDGSGTQNAGNAGQNAVSNTANLGRIESGLTVEQAINTCGTAQLNCCNKVSNTGDTSSAGVLGSVFGSGDLGVQCSPLDILAIGIQVPINKACDTKAACCQESTLENGLINAACVGLDSLI